MGKYALIVVSGFVLSFGVVQSQLNRTRVDFSVLHMGAYDRANAANIRNSAVNLAIMELTADPAWRTGWSNRTLFGGASEVILEDSAADTTLPRSVIRITSVSTSGGVVDTTEVLWRRIAFSEYAYFTNIEPTIYFTTGDTLKGPVHSNGTLHMAGAPVFTGRVTSPNNWQGWGSPVFQGPTNFAHAPITLPIDLAHLVNAASMGGLVLSPASSRSLWLDFQSNGTVRHAYLDDGTEPTAGTTWSTLDLSTINGVIVCSEEIHVKGTLNGQVTIASNKNVHIEDDIVYAADPRSGASDDLMGIVSRQDIIVEYNTPNLTDCHIHASLLAMGKFTVENYAYGTPRGTLNILGGVVQDTRGAVGTLGSYGLKSGYLKKYVYDDRLMEAIPPAYPITGENTGGSSYAPGRVMAWYE